jgi:hypothetical protein
MYNPCTKVCTRIAQLQNRTILLAVPLLYNFVQESYVFVPRMCVRDLLSGARSAATGLACHSQVRLRVENGQGLYNVLLRVTLRFD